MRRKGSLLLSVLLLFTMSGCVPGMGGGDFTYYLDDSVKSLDPQTASGAAAQIVVTAVFEGLCRLNSKGEAIPGVAEEWEANEDYTNYTFRLRKNATWSDGTSLTAADFVYAFQRGLDPATKAANLDDLFLIANAERIYLGLEPPSALGVSAPDPHTLAVKLERPAQNFPEITASPKLMPCNREFFTSTHGRYGLQPEYLLTNGPFAFSASYSLTEGDSIVLNRNSKYQGTRAPKPDTLTFSMKIPEEISADPSAALAEGEADVLPLNHLQSEAAAAAGCNILSYNNAVTGLIFNSSCEALSNANLRGIFVKTIDRKNLLDSLPKEFLPTGDCVPDSINWGNGNYRETAGTDFFVKSDPAAPAQLPAILQTLDKDVVPSITILCKDDSFSMSLANKLIISWNGIMGNYFNILPVPPDEFDNKLLSRDYQVALCTVTASGNTPYSFLKAFESSGYLLADPAYDTLLHQANKELSDYVNLENFLHNQYIFYPLYKEKTYLGISPKVKGLLLTGGRVDFLDATK